MTSILIVDDHRIVRLGLRTLIENNQGMEVLAEASDGNSAIKLACELNPQLVIMDISLPGLNGIEAARKILALNPKTKLIVLSMHDDEQFVIESLKVGASGYLLKDCTFKELIHAINEVMEGKTYLCSKVNEYIIKNYVANASKCETSAFSVLTVRQREVLQMMAEGYSTKIIASELNVSVKTIETHRQRIMDKLDIHSVAELTKYAIKAGLTSP
jgi:two-component system, NarL family, response regulator NreC